MGGGNRAYETDGEGRTRKGESIRNVNKKCRKKKKKKPVLQLSTAALNHTSKICRPENF